MSSYPSVPVSEIAEIKSGVGFPVELQGNASGDIPFAKVSDISNAVLSGRSELTAAANYVSQDTVKDLKAEPIPPGAVIFAKIGEAIRKERRVLTVQPTMIDNNVVALIPHTDVIFPRYLYYFMRSVQLYPLASTTAVPSINRRVFASTRVPLPPIEEQKRIAAILDKADRLRSLREQAIAKLDQLAQSIFLDMFGDPVTNPKGWETAKIQELARDEKESMRTGPFGSDLLHSEFVDQGVPVLGIDNVVDNVFRWKQWRFITEAKYEKLKRYRVFPGDVLVTIMGTTGRSAVVPQDIGRAINTKHLAAITLDQSRCLPEYLSFCIHSDPFVLHQITDQNRGAIMAGLNLTIIKNVRVRVPSIAAQEDFVQRLRVSGRIGSVTQGWLARSETLSSSLSQRAFKGEL